MLIKRLTAARCKSFTAFRKGETKLGERVHLLKSDNLSGLNELTKKGVKFGLLGIPECIGVLGNMGNPGAEHAWQAFLSFFLNVQSNRFLSGNEFVVLGHVEVSDLQERAIEANRSSEYFLQQMHMICEAVDDRVSPLIEEVVASGLIPVVIGGGHNNAFPVIRGVANGLGRKRGINVINMDAHADFRALEGRHSGNGFSSAKHKGYLNKYFAFGLHESYNGENMLKSMDRTRTVAYQMLEDITYLDQELAEAMDYVFDEHVPCGIELDMDAIRLMPSSATSPSGFSLEQARHFVRKCAAGLKAGYLHLPEAAPGNDLERTMVGKALSYLVCDFAKSL